MTTSPNRPATKPPEPISIASKPPAWRLRRFRGAAGAVTTFVPDCECSGFERRAVIAYQVEGDEVVIVRIFYGGQDFERVLRRMAEE